MTAISTLSPQQARRRIREGFTGTTSGWCDGWAQTNVLSVPSALALDGMRCRGPV